MECEDMCIEDDDESDVEDYLESGEDVDEDDL
jgi:hypothetical protein